MKVYFNNSCKICKAEIDLYKKEKIQEIEWIDITNNELAKKETSRNSKELLRRLHVKENEKVKPNQSKDLITLLEAFGEVVKFSEESKFDAVTAISGSGPAYIFLIAELMTEVGVNLGLSQDEAFKLVKHTIDGAGSLIVNSSLEHQKLRKKKKKSLLFKNYMKSIPIWIVE